MREMLQTVDVSDDEHQFLFTVLGPSQAPHPPAGSPSVVFRLHAETDDGDEVTMKISGQRLTLFIAQMRMLFAAISLAQEEPALRTTE